MANEIQLGSSLGVSSGTLNISRSSNAQKDQTNINALTRKQTLTTSDTALSFTGLTSVRAIQVENLDATNYVEFGPDDSGAILPFVRLLPGDNAVIPLKPGITIRAQANTASVQVAIMAVDA